jgi:hypothetical protein
MTKIARVFPRRTSATPTDELAFINEPPGMFPPEVDEVHVSVSFGWDIQTGERLAKEWRHIAPVKMDGPALGTKGEAFTPGLYLGEGYTITSRGCPNRCWFCRVWKTDGDIRELPIKPGWIIADDNILATSREHFANVMQMLAEQRNPAVFSGGLESALLTPWHAGCLRKLRTERLYFAYDTPNDLEPLRAAGKMLREAGFDPFSQKLRAYVLCGWGKGDRGKYSEGDTFDAAEKRMRETIDAGFFPYAMLWHDKNGKMPTSWRKFQSKWVPQQRVSTQIPRRDGTLAKEPEDVNLPLFGHSYG